MTDVERELRTMLARRAGSVSRRGEPARTLRRARRRRAATASSALVLTLVVATGAVAAIDGFGSDPVRRPAAPHVGERFEFSSTPGEHPYVATGTFRGVEWALRAAAVALEPRAGVRVSVELSARDRRHASGSFLLPQSYGILVAGDVADEHVLGDAEVVYGTVVPDVAAVEVEIHDGEGQTRIPAHLFSEYGGRAGYFAAGYYIAFIPRDAEGYLVARGRDGTEVARRALDDRVEDANGSGSQGEP